jgi:long-chain acyl-CoA synthetase
MSEHHSSLDRALEDWREGGQTPEAPALAQDLLTAAERALELDAAPFPQTGGEREQLWRRYLDQSGERRFLLALPDPEARYRWANTTFSAIRRADYRLLSLLERNLARCPRRTFLQEQVAESPTRWSYQQVERALASIAAAFFAATETGVRPRVAILAENGLHSASCDLACLLHGIFVSPLNVHTDSATLAWICEQLAINVIVTDNEERCRTICRAREKLGDAAPRVVLLSRDADCGDAEDAILLPETTARIGRDEAKQLIAAQPRPGLHEVATVLFTSGSTGKPKGVSFSHYQLVAKRFARHGALPDVGAEELLFAYLPLYHTFGRYLELLGMLYWGGTYVFAGNPSTDTLLAGLARERPTGLISIPLRWAQIHERCAQRLGDDSSPEAQRDAVAEICGGRLRWGLSAAGYLDPAIFRFFQRNGVALGSGFGMTEATGGITMSPPGDYKDDTVGIPLPGVELRFGEHDELQVKGQYIARYLEDAGPGDAIDPDADYWLATGDLFMQLGDGHVKIVDRIKDIYKNSKGQTIAPRRVEQKFTSVPGIARTFLVGDGRSHNVLLVKLRDDEPLICDLREQQQLEAYIGRLITEANRDLAPYERVVNFALLERDFSEERGELTAKGSYRRKVIEASFAEQIERLYRSRYVDLALDSGARVRIPRWFYRDLGVLETDISEGSDGLVDERRERTLTIERGHAPGFWRIGDLEYTLQDSNDDGVLIDVGLFTRQPWLWVGNPQLAAFCPCKEGWDLPLGRVSRQVRLPELRERSAPNVEAPAAVRDPNLVQLDVLVQRTFFSAAAEALEAVEALGSLLAHSDHRVASLARRRLGALAHHDHEELRCTAYRILLLDEPMPDYGEAFGVFIASGLSFLNERSIKRIAQHGLQPRRLEALRRRLHGYRTRLGQLTPASRAQLRRLLELLTNFVRQHPEYFAPVRSELAAWALYRVDPELAGAAARKFEELATWFAEWTTPDPVASRDSEWQRRLVFETSIGSDERQRIIEALTHPTFLRRTMLLAYEERSFGLGQVPPSGIWVTQILTSSSYRRYRLSINTRKHFDLQLVLRQGAAPEEVEENDKRAIAMAGFPLGTPVLPRFGCRRSDPQAAMLRYNADLTVWDKIRQFSSATEVGDRPWPRVWRKLFVRAFATIFRAWGASERRVVPGWVSPTNVLVPEVDYREGAVVLSLSDWSPYERPSDLLRPVLHNFYQRTAAHYPWCEHYLDRRWVFDAAIEAMGDEAGCAWLRELCEELSQVTLIASWPDVVEELERYLDERRRLPYTPLAADNVVDQYGDWRERNPGADVNTGEDALQQLFSAYRLERYPEWTRFQTYHRTVFAQAAEPVLQAFDTLLEQMYARPQVPATQLVELSELQATLQDPADREVLSRMIFPRTQRARSLRVQTVGESDTAQVVVRTGIVDRVNARYTIRAPLEPAEIGKLYRLFHQEKYPQQVQASDQYLIVIDSRDAIVGGLVYELRGEQVAYIDSMVITHALQRRGIGGALLDELCTRSQERGVSVVKANLLLRELTQRQGFVHDPRWGGLVRFIDESSEGDPAEI